MKKSLIMLVGIVILAIIAFFVASGSKDKDKTSTPSNTTPTNNSSTSTDQDTTTPDTSTSQTASVSITDFSFSPSTLTVKKGTTVTWPNKDTTAHTVTVDGTTGPNSETLAQNDAYQFTFNTAGTFNYFCKFHSNMTAKVTVTE